MCVYLYMYVIVGEIVCVYMRGKGCVFVCVCIWEALFVCMCTCSVPCVWVSFLILLHLIFLEECC